MAENGRCVHRVFVLAAVVLLTALAAPPALGAQETTTGPGAEDVGDCTDPCHLPDARIRRSVEPTAIGDGLYNWDSLGQTRVHTVGAGGTARFQVRLENDGTEDDDLVLQGSRHTTNFWIRYFVDDEEISAAVRNGTYRFAAVGPGGFRSVRIEVTAKGSAPVRSRAVARLAVASGAEPVLRDRVKAVVYRSQGVETPIEGRSFTSRLAAQRWARNQGASGRFVLNAELYWELASSRGIRPEVAYAQSAKETAYGNFGGAIDESWNNPCGLKTTVGGDNGDPNAHQRFVNWRQGVTACIDHLALYAGAPGYPRAATPDPRHFDTIYATAPTVERLGGRWAPAPDYGRSIVQGYLNPLLGS